MLSNLQIKSEPAHNNMKNSNANLVNSLISQAASDIKIKKEPLSHSESDTNEKFSSALKTAGKRNPTKNDLIVQLLQQENKVLSKNKKRKSHNESQDAVVLLDSKSIKTEKEDLLEQVTGLSQNSTKSELSEGPKLSKKSKKSPKKAITGTDSATSDQEISVPKPLKIKRESFLPSEIVNSTIENVKPSSKHNKVSRHETTVNYKDLEDSNEEVSVPQPIQIKTEYLPSSQILTKSNKVPTSVKDVSPKKVSTRTESTSSSEEDTLIPKPLQIKSESHLPLETATNSRSFKHNKVSRKQSIVSHQDADSDSSNEEITVPKPMQIKKEYSPSQIGDKSMKVDKVTPRKNNISESSDNDNSNQDAELESSDEELYVPKPKHLKKENRQLLPTSKIKKTPRSRASINNTDSESESSSEEELSVPKPKKIKTEQSSRVTTKFLIGNAKAKPVSRNTVDYHDTDSGSSDSVPKPIQLKTENFESPEVVLKSGRGGVKPSPSNKKLVSPRVAEYQGSQSESSDDEESLPKPKQRKNDNFRFSEVAAKSTPSGAKPAPKPKKTPANQNVISQQYSGSASSDSELSVPKPKQIKNENSYSSKVVGKAVRASVKPSPKGKRSAGTESTVKSEESESSDEQFSVPKPKEIKNENFESSKVVDKNRKKAGVKSSSKNKGVAENKKRVNYEESESSDDEITVPKPKYIKYEAQSFKMTGESKQSMIKKPPRSQLSVSNQDSDEESYGDATPIPKPIKSKNEINRASNSESKNVKQTASSHRKSLSLSEREIGFESKNSNPNEVRKKPPKDQEKLPTSSKALANVKEKLTKADYLNKFKSQKSASESNSEEDTESSSDEQSVKRTKQPVKPKTDSTSSSDEDMSQSSLRNPGLNLPKQHSRPVESTKASRSTSQQQVQENSSKVNLAEKQVEASHSETENSTDDESMPQPIKTKPEASSSYSEVEMPKPLQVKGEVGESFRGKQTSSDLKSSTKNEKSATMTKIHDKLNSLASSGAKRSRKESSDRNSTSSQASPQQQEESDSEPEVPFPKKIKLELDHFESLGKSSSREVVQNKNMSWKEKLKFNYPRIETEANSSTTLPKTDVTYSLLLVPKAINPQSLVNIKYHPTKARTIRVNDKEYLVEPLEKKPDPVVINLNGPRLIKPQRTLCFGAFVPDIALKELDVPRRENVYLPSNIKKRHPLFGPNYKPKLSIDKTVSKQLEEAVELKRKVERKEEKRMRKRKRQSQSYGVEEDVLNIFNSINTSSRGVTVKSDFDSSISSKRKRRNSYAGQDLVLSQSLVEGSSKKHKRHKKDKVNGLVATSPVEENHKKKKRKSH